MGFPCLGHHAWVASLRSTGYNRAMLVFSRLTKAIFLSIIFLFFFGPLTWLLLASVNGSPSFSWEIPRPTTVENYTDLVAEGDIFLWLRNSFILEIAFMYTLLLARVMPVAAVIIPIFSMAVMLDLVNRFSGAILLCQRDDCCVLQKMGHKVTIVAYRNGNDLPELDIRRTLPIPWRSDYEVGSSRHKIGFDFLLGLKTLQLLAFNRYDVIHAHLHEGALIGLVLGKLFNIPVVFDLQGSLTEEMIDHNFLQRDSAIYKPLRRLEEWIVRASPAIFTSSAHAERMVIQKFQGRPERVKLLPDCVNTGVFRPSLSRSFD